jgi:DNA-binding LytR/AlgR family response regulator
MKIDEKEGKLIVKKRNHIILININEILYIERVSTYSVIHTYNDEFLTNNTLKDIIRYLPEQFVRAHKSFIINKMLLRELKPLTPNIYEAIFSDEKTALVSRKLIELIC